MKRIGAWGLINQTPTATTISANGGTVKYNPFKHHRRSIRLKEYDYSSAGAYFVTAVVQDRTCLFGSVRENRMQLNDAGKIANQCWENIPNHFRHVELDEFIIMPNHMHGIIFILPDDDNRGGVLDRGLINQAPITAISTNRTPITTDWILMKNPKRTLGKIVRWYKARATKMIRDFGEEVFQWQRNYHDRIIRNERELVAIREYIINNPINWMRDKKNQDRN